MTVEIDNNSETTTETEAELTPEQLKAERAALLKKAAELLDEKKSLANSLKAFEGIDPAKARQLQAEKEANDKKMALARGEFETLEANLKQAHQTREQALVGTLDKALRSEAAVKAIADAGGNATLLLPHVLNRSKMIEQDGEFVVQVLDKHGLPMEGKNFADLMTELQADENFLGAFASKAASGGGAANLQTTGLVKSGVSNPYAKDTFSLHEQGILERDNPSLAQQLRNEAAG